jgi:hypothetical protein
MSRRVERSLWFTQELLGDVRERVRRATRARTRRRGTIAVMAEDHVVHGETQTLRGQALGRDADAGTELEDSARDFALLAVKGCDDERDARGDRLLDQSDAARAHDGGGLLEHRCVGDEGLHAGVAGGWELGGVGEG